MAKSFPDSLVKQFEQRARAERRGGGHTEINHRIPTVAIVLSNGDEFFFQESEAAALLDEVPDNLSEGDYLLATAQGW
jgi:hypothetical protein